MRFALTAALKDIRRRLHDPAALVMWLGLPIVIGGLMSILSAGNGPAVKAHLLVVDDDQSLASRLLLSGARQGQLGDLLDVESVTAADGRRKIDAGDASALLTIPKGFQDAVLREQPATLALVTNPAERVLPRIIEEGLDLLVEAVFYAQRLFEPAVRQLAGTIGGTSAPSDDRVAAISRAFNQRLRALQTTLFPPVLSLESKTDPSETGGADFWSLFLPGLVFMSIMFAAQGMSLDIWTEKTHGTLRRTLSAPAGPAAFLAGKLVAGAAIMAAAGTAALILAVGLFHVPVGRAPLALLWTTLTGAAIFCYLVLIQLHATTMRGGQFLSTMIVFPLVMIGGSFFPFETMPAWMARAGRWTPNGLGVSMLKQMLFGRVEGWAVAAGTAALIVPAALAFLLAVRRLRGTFATS